MLNLDESTHLLEKILDVAPSVVDKIQSMIKKNNQNTNSNGWKNHQPTNQKQDFDF